MSPENNEKSFYTLIIEDNFAFPHILGWPYVTFCYSLGTK